MQCLKSELLCLVEERQAPWRGCLTFGIRDSSCVLDQAPNPPNECQLWCIYCCINCCALNVHAVVTDTACCLSSSERWNAPQWLIRSRWMASTCGAFLSVNTHVRACNQLTVRKKKTKTKKNQIHTCVQVYVQLQLFSLLFVKNNSVVQHLEPV